MGTMTDIASETAARIARDYDEDTRQATLAASGELTDPTPVLPPEPGTGTIWISPFQEGWSATWECVDGDEVRSTSLDEATYDEAVEWARRQRAERRMILAGDDYVAL